LRQLQDVFPSYDTEEEQTEWLAFCHATSVMSPLRKAIGRN
jgi:hypothetical protein